MVDVSGKLTHRQHALLKQIAEGRAVPFRILEAIPPGRINDAVKRNRASLLALGLIAKRQGLPVLTPAGRKALLLETEDAT